MPTGLETGMAPPMVDTTCTLHVHYRYTATGMTLPMVDALPIVSSKYYYLLPTTNYLLGMARPMIDALPMALPMAQSIPMASPMTGCGPCCGPGVCGAIVGCERIVTTQFSPAGGCMGDMGGGMPMIYTPEGIPVAEAVRI